MATDNSVLTSGLPAGVDMSPDKDRREALWFCLINHFEHNVDYDYSEPNSRLTRKKLSFEEKKRYRNMCYIEAERLVKEYNDRRKSDSDRVYTVNDPDIVINAFFNTPLGHKFESYRSTWIDAWSKDDKGDIVDITRDPISGFDKCPTNVPHTDVELSYKWIINRWTINNKYVPNTGGKVLSRTVLSPYDPAYSKTDGLGDRMGYAMSDKDAVFAWSATNSPAQANWWTNNDIIVYPQGSTLKAMKDTSSDSIKLVSDEYVNSGYLELMDYVINSRDKARLRKSLGIDGSRNAVPLVMTEDQRTYISGACEYLSNLGYDYDIDISGSSAAGDLNINFKVNNVSVNLYNSNYDNQGYIYRNGNVTQLDIYPDSNNRDSAISDNMYTITARDRLSMLKTYFGENVPVNDPAGIIYNPGSHGNVPLYIGQSHKASIANSALRKTFGTNDSGDYYPSKHSTSYNLKSAAMVSVLQNNNNPNLFKPLYMTTRAASFGKLKYSSTFDFINSMFIKNTSYPTKYDPEKEYGKFANIPAEYILDDDKVVDANGNLLDKFDLTRGNAYSEAFAKSGKSDYYTMALIHSTLDRWVEQAKVNHSRLLDLDTLFDLYSSEDVDETAIDAWLNDIDEDMYMRDIKEICNDIMSGYISDLSVDDSIVISAGDTLESRIQAVKDYYDNYIRIYFGSVPAMDKAVVENGVITDFGGLVQTGEELGFVPDNIIRYTRGDLDEGVQGTAAMVRYMVHRLSEHYDVNDLIKGDSYSAVDMKNKTIRYDENKSIFSFDVQRNIDPSILAPDKSNITDPDDPNFRTNFEKRFAQYYANTIQRRGYMPSSAFFTNPALRNAHVKAFNVMLQSGLEEQGLPVRDMSVTADMLVHTISSLYKNGCSDDLKISIDANGVIRYECNFLYSHSPQEKKNGNATDKYKHVVAEIGQVFEPDENGVVELNTFVPSNSVRVPGYMGTIIPNNSTNPMSLDERVRLRSWKREMKDMITQEVRDSARMLPAEYVYTPRGAVLNSVFSRGHGITIDKDDYFNRLPKDPENPTDEEKLFLATIRSNVMSVHFDKRYSNGATTDAAAVLNNPHVVDESASSFDCGISDFVDNHNLRVHPVEFDGMFCKRHVSGGKNQGTNVFMVEGAKVDDVTGKVEKSTDKDDTSPMLKQSAFKNSNHDTADRVLGATNNTSSALGFERSARFAMMNFNGATFEDGIVMSKKFAEQHLIRDAEGNYRPLLVQDKGSDFHFNKGVHTYIIDPDFYYENVLEKMQLCDWNTSKDIESLSEASVTFNDRVYDVTFDPKSEESHAMQAVHYIQKMNDMFGLDEEMKVYIDNPDLDLIVSPYSSMSRFNAGTLLDMNADAKPLIVNGKAIEGGIGTMYYQIHDMTADVKTKVYADGHIKGAKGRKASGQLAWCIQARSAADIYGPNENFKNGIMKELFGNNDRALHNEREYFIAMGLDLDQEAKPRIGYSDHESERRNLIKMPDDSEFGNTITIERTKSFSKAYEEFATNANPSARMHRMIHLEDETAIEKEFSELFEHTGGFLELPFNLTFTATDKIVTGSISGSKNDSSVVNLLSTGHTYMDPVSGQKKQTYAMPIMPYCLRSGREFSDGDSVSHNYTRKYMGIYKNSLLYRVYEQELARAADAKENSDYIKTLQGCMDMCQKTSQNLFDEITDDIIKRKINEKKCCFREETMAKPIKNSATAVWSADPRLDIDQIKVSREIADAMHLKDGDYLFVWRDPVTKDDVASYMKVTIDRSPAEDRYDKSLDAMRRGAAANGDAFDIDKCKPVQFTFESYANYPMMSDASLRNILSNDPYIVAGLDTGNNIPVIHRGIRVAYRDAEGNITETKDMTTSAYETMLTDHPEKLCNCVISDRYTINDQEVTVDRGVHDQQGEFELSLEAKNSTWTKVNDYSVHGVRVHPAIAKAFNGDFDGDSCALAKLETKAAHLEAKKLFTREHNLLNRGAFKTVDPSDYPGLIGADGKKEVTIYPLCIEPSLEISSHLQSRPDLKEKYTKLTILANNIQTLKDKISENSENARYIAVINGELVYREGDNFIANNKSIPHGLGALDKMSKECLKGLNEWTHESIRGIGTDYIDAKSYESLAKSCQNIIDHKAKGDSKKCKFLFGNMGVMYETKDVVDDKGNVVDTTIDFDKPMVALTDEKGNLVSKSEYEDTFDEDNNALRLVASLKADGTALGGTSAQRAVMAFRDVEDGRLLEVAMFMTEPTTQSILQSKHDPAEASHKDTIARYWGKDALNGYKLTGIFDSDDKELIRNSPHDKISVQACDKNGMPIVDRNGNPVYTYEKCTREEWITQTKGMMKAFGVDVHPDYISRIADAMFCDEKTTYVQDGHVVSKSGYVMGLEDFAEKHASLLDQLAYNGGYNARLTTLVSEACKPESTRRSLFGNAVEAAKSGDLTSMNNTATFAPKAFVEGHKNGKPVMFGYDDARIDMQSTFKNRMSYLGESQDYYEFRKANPHLTYEEVDRCKKNYEDGDGEGGGDGIGISIEIQTPETTISRPI